MVQTVSFDVSDEEYQALIEMKGRKTWRELLLTPLGIETERRKPGPKKNEEAQP